MEKYRLYKFVFQPSHTKEADWTQSVVAEATDLSKAQEIFEKILIIKSFIEHTKRIIFKSFKIKIREVVKW